MPDLSFSPSLESKPKPAESHDGTFDVLIAGAGIGGLALAWRLTKAGRRVLVADEATRPGGVITTVQRDGWLLEKGPNSFSSGEEIVALINEVGLESRALAQPIRDSDRFVWKRGQLRKVPMGLGEFLRTSILSPAEKLRTVAGVFWPARAPRGDVAMGEYFRRRIGNGAVDSLLKPFMAGVYASDADRISLRSALPKLFDAAEGRSTLFGALLAMRKRAPRRKGPRKPRALMSFPDGLQELSARLAEAITSAGGTIALGRAISLQRGTNRRWAFHFAGNDSAGEADEIVLTSPAEETAALLESISPTAASFLRSVEYAGLTVIHVGAPREMFSETRNGFGFLAVPGHGVEALGMIWSSFIFPGRAPEGHRLLTCFYGGDIHPGTNDWTDEQLRETLIKDLKKTMGWRGGEFSLFEIERWKRALPLFRVGNHKGLRRATESLPAGVHLFANYMGHVSMPDRVRLATELAGKLTRQHAGKNDG